MTPKEHLESALATVQRASPVIGLTVPDAVLEAVRSGAASLALRAERTRIRQELRDGFFLLASQHPGWRGHATLAKTVADLIDLVCPEEAS